MNKTNTGKHYGFTQYCYPKDFELSGRKITLVSGNGSCTLNFIDRSFIEYTDESGDTLSQYEALKLDDDTHMVFSESILRQQCLTLKTVMPLSATAMAMNTLSVKLKAAVRWENCRGIRKIWPVLMSDGILAMSVIWRIRTTTTVLANVYGPQEWKNTVIFQQNIFV